MPTWKRYLLFQIPGWIIAAVVLTSLWYWHFLPRWLAVLCLLVWFLKDFIFYPLTRTAYQTDTKTGAEALVGTKGVVEGNLAPEGYVRIRRTLARREYPRQSGDLWRHPSRDFAGRRHESLCPCHRRGSTPPMIP